DIAGLERFEGEDGRVGQVSQFMSEKPETLASASGLSLDAGLDSFAPVLGDRASDGIVEAAIQCPKVRCVDRGVQLHRQLGDRLADIAVAVYDLRHGEPLKQKVMPVEHRGAANLR